MSLKKDKEKVIGERFDDDRIKTFLHVEAYDNISPDFCALEKAYRGMVADNFATFVKFFVEEGLDINATNGEGKTILQIVSEHRQGQEYAAALKSVGAK